MKIGTLLYLERFDIHSRQMKKYHCKVIEKSEHYLFIDYPINQQSKKSTFFPKGETFSVTYRGNDQNIYYFHSEIVAKLKLTVPALAIKFPDKSKRKRIQRREFVRIETGVDVALHSTDQSFLPFVTVTSDISGGGLSIVLPKQQKLDVHDIVEVWIPIQISLDEFNYIHATTEVVLIKPMNQTISTASLKFTNISKQSQQCIIRYCFEKQREARQRELSYLKN